jgi:hypothetical protein
MQQYQLCTLSDIRSRFSPLSLPSLKLRTSRGSSTFPKDSLGKIITGAREPIDQPALSSIHHFDSKLHTEPLLYRSQQWHRGYSHQRCALSRRHPQLSGHPEAFKHRLEDSQMLPRHCQYESPSVPFEEGQLHVLLRPFRLLQSCPNLSPNVLLGGNCFDSCS